jgi:general secretion pathway protein F/type IV pilus assembly protein PilC
MTYKYKAYTKEGVLTKGEIQANDEKEAKAKLKSQSLLVETLTEKKEISFLRNTIPNEILIPISRDLSLYIRAGIPISQALKLIRNSYKKKHRNFLDNIIDYIDEGNSFYHSLKMQKVYLIKDFYLESIKVAEENSFLDVVLMDLSKFLNEQEKLKSKIVSAMTYPLFLMFVAVSMVFVMLTYIVPQIVSIFANMNQELPKITQVVLSLSYFLQHNITIIITLLTVLVGGFVILLKTSTPFKRKIDLMILHTPIINKIIIKDELAKFAHIVSLLNGSGVNFTKAIYLATNTLNNLVIREIFMEASDKVVEGQKLSQMLMKNRIIEVTFIQAIILAEETSQVKEILNSVALSYFEENDEKIGRFLGLFEPFLMLFIGGVIGLIIVSMLLPIFNLNVGLK